MNSLFNLQYDLVKAEIDEEKPNTAKISGVISTEELDLQGEIVKQDGLDFDYFLKKGYFNYEHKAGVENLLGYPTKVSRRNGETSVEGVLLLDRPKAKDIYDTALSMKKAGGRRTLGFSIEGQVLERDEMNPKIVTKARVINCAITSNPINPETNLALLKAIINKGILGYQTASTTDENGLNSLIPQQLDRVLSVQDSNIVLYDDLLSNTIKALSVSFPAVDRKTLVKTAKQLIQEFYPK